MLHFITVLETLIGKKAVIRMREAQPGDMAVTYADIDKTTKELGYLPGTTVEQGLEKFMAWFMTYYRYNK